MRFLVKALAPGGGVALLELDAASPAEAGQRAAADGFSVLSITGTGGQVRFAREARFPLLQFAQELQSLLESGIALIEAVATLAEKEARAQLRSVYEGVILALSEGRTFSGALESRSDVFPALFVATVRASERTGSLAEGLGRFVAYQTRLNEVRAKLVNAAIYPALLVVVGSLVILFLMVYVVPRFSHIYEDLGGDLPLLSRWLLAGGAAIEQHGWLLLVAAIAAMVLLAATLRERAVRAWFGAGLWRIEAIGARMKIYQLARFFRTVGMLVRGGVPVVSALAMARGLLQAHLQGALDGAVARVREGQSLSAAMAGHGLSTPVVARMLRVGEKSGDLGGMMERIAVFYDAETERAAEWLTRLFSPLLMLAMGLIIGVVVVLMYLPIFQLAEQVR